MRLGVASLGASAAAGSWLGRRLPFPQQIASGSRPGPQQQISPGAPYADRLAGARRSGLAPAAGLAGLAPPGRRGPGSPRSTGGGRPGGRRYCWRFGPRRPERLPRGDKTSADDAVSGEVADDDAAGEGRKPPPRTMSQPRAAAPLSRQRRRRFGRPFRWRHRLGRLCRRTQADWGQRRLTGRIKDEILKKRRTRSTWPLADEERRSDRSARRSTGAHGHRQLSRRAAQRS